MSGVSAIPSCFRKRAPPGSLSDKAAGVWRVTSLVMGTTACLVAGTLYTFGSWAPTMKAVFSTWGQGDINFVGSIGDIGLYLSFTMGLVYDGTAPWFTMLVGGALQGLGYLLMALAVRGDIAPGGNQAPWGLMAFFFALAGQGSFATFTAGYGPSLANHPGRYRSRVMGLMVGSFAMSSILCALLFRFGYRMPDTAPIDARRDSLAQYLMVLAAVTSGVSFMCAFLVRDVGCAPIVTDDEPPLQEDVRPDVAPWRLVLYLDWWLLWGAMFAVTGPGLLMINVQGSAAKSLGRPTIGDTLVIVLGVGNVVGRLLCGLMSDLTATRLSRAYYFVPAGLIMAVGHFSFAWFQHELIYVASIATGLAYGIGFAIGTTLVSALFGKRYMGTNIGLLSLAPAIAGLVFGQINGALYRMHANIDNGKYCEGVVCFKLTFILSSCMALVAVVLGFWLGRRTPAFARSQLDEKKPLINESSSESVRIDE